MTNCFLPQGSITTTKECGKFWLRFIAATWANASCVPVKDEMAVLENHLEAKNATLARWYYGLKGVYDALYDGEMFNIDLRLELKDGELKAQWHSLHTRGRFVSVTLTEKECCVQWDTATGKESEFLQMPSTAAKFIYDGSGRERKY